jgi:glucosamine--fructose-6-phosphate aminotransferase (isomerizing)
MCGIFGLNTYSISKNDIKIFEKLGILSESRGREASGWASFNNSEISIFKSPKPFSSTENIANLRKLYNKEISSWLVGHTRLKTHGEESIPDNNQPCTIDGDFLVHNGIITNYQDIINKYNFKFQSELDSFTILKMINHYGNLPDNYFETALTKTINQLKGEVSICGYSKKFNQFYLYSNTGSIYYMTQNKRLVLFASENSIVKKVSRIFNNTFEISKLEKNTCIIFNDEGKIIKNFKITTNGYELNYKDLNQIKINFQKKVLIPDINRCSRCILPSTVPFINFNSENICNYCENYQKHSYQPLDELKSILNGKKIISGLSGGRDSSYGLLRLSKDFNVEIIAATYDWGMVTELARRNQARIVGKLGIEHLWISADIVKKRKYIKKNLTAWLEDPHPGLIPILMAGDKVWQKKLNLAKKETQSNYVLQFECPYEETFFKYGFANVKPHFQKSSYRINLASQAKLFIFYIYKILLNYKYWNLSIFDSLKGFYSFYYDKKDYIFPYQYMEFNEENVNNQLSKEFQWEFDESTTTSWRIGDGTSPFYNYLYYRYAGFTENDFFRSNQIREGIITRYEGLNMVHLENQPRIKRIEEYLEYINLNFKDVDEKLNKFFNDSLIEKWLEVEINGQ